MCGKHELNKPQNAVDSSHGVGEHVYCTICSKKSGGRAVSSSLSSDPDCQYSHASSRHNNAVVVYDPQSQRLISINSSQGPLELTECPTCHRPFRDDTRSSSNERGHSHHEPSPAYVHPQYFRILHDNIYGSHDSSTPPSPRRRLVQPVVSPEDSSASPRQSAYVESPPASPPTPGHISATSFSPGYFQRCYVVEKELGRGGKGVVLLVTHVLDGNMMGLFACKRVPVGDDRQWLKNVLTEVQYLYHLEHKHLVRYHHVWLEDVKLSNFGPSVPCAFILQQYCNAGDLNEYVLHPAKKPVSPDQLKERLRRRSKNQPELPLDLRARKLSFDEIKSFFKDITSGLNHLHVNGYIHRDLKPSNCLLHDDGSGERPHVLVSDFGEVQVVDMVRKSTGATGTISYCAPEVLRRQSTGEYGNFTTKSDIFSLGMILYFLCFAQLPYRSADILNEDNEDLDQLREEITTWSGLHEERKLRPDLPEQLYTFLRRLLSLDPEERPSAEIILLGIKTGSGLDRISDARPRSAGHVFDDLRNDSRISPVDSPRASTPVRKMSTGYSHPGPPATLRLASFQHERRLSSTPIAETRGSRSPEATSPNGSLVVRDKFPSPAKIPEIPQLIAPPDVRPTGILNTSLQRLNVQLTLKTVLLLLKVISLSTFCTPMAANRAVAYPLLGMAALDVAIGGWHLAVSITLVVVHVAILLWAARSNVLCMSAIGYWKEF